MTIRKINLSAIALIAAGAQALKLLEDNSIGDIDTSTTSLAQDSEERDNSHKYKLLVDAKVD